MTTRRIPRSAAQFAALLLDSQRDLRVTVALLADAGPELQALCDGVTPDAERLRLTGLGLQVEAMRLATMSLSLRAAGERLNVVAQLLAGEAGK